MKRYNKPTNNRIKKKINQLLFSNFLKIQKQCRKQKTLHQTIQNTKFTITNLKKFIIKCKDTATGQNKVHYQNTKKISQYATQANDG